MKKLKIAIFCTNQWPTPPPKTTFYAPLWIVYYIAEGLAKKGHKVFYFGSKESKLKYAKLISDNKPATKYNKELLPYWPQKANEMVTFDEFMLASKIYLMGKKEKFDIINIHPYRRAIPLAVLTKTPTVITIHDPIEGLAKYMLSFTKKIPQIYLISLSNAQRRPLPNLNYIGTVYNGIELKNFKFNKKPKDYFVLAGRFVPEKGIDLAILAAKKAGVKLKLAGGPAEGEYWERKIRPHLGKQIEYVGMLSYFQMGQFYGQGKALLAPIRWEEPFGLYFIEAMACGTPVIAFPRGSAPEVIKNQRTGFLVKNLNEMVKAIKKIDQIQRKDCRKWVESNFTLETMVENYEKVFYKISEKNKK